MSARTAHAAPTVVNVQSIAPDFGHSSTDGRMTLRSPDTVSSGVQ